jgi:hypothetical protein
MADVTKETPEVWAAGIGRKSNAQYGSDLMVEVLRELGIKYIALNPGASYRGLHDSMVNFETGKGPEIIMCTHEEIAVALANGYARATGMPAWRSSTRGATARRFSISAAVGRKIQPTDAQRTGSTRRTFKGTRCASTLNSTISRTRLTLSRSLS